MDTSENTSYTDEAPLKAYEAISQDIIFEFKDAMQEVKEELTALSENSQEGAQS